MLTDKEFAAWTERISLSEDAQTIVSQIRQYKPTRPVSGNERYTSKKMGAIIPFESPLGDLPAIFELEYDDNVLEYYNNEPACFLYIEPLGLTLRPSFFVIRADSAGWVECRTGEELDRLSEQDPGRYCFCDTKWISPRGYEYAAPLGLYYSVRSSDETDWNFQRFIILLERTRKNRRWN